MIGLLWALLVAVTHAMPMARSGPQLIKKNLAFDYSWNKLYGVNIGGWFVLEPYITPSLFELFGDNIPVDEYHLTQAYGKDALESVLQLHWSTWYTEKDFEDIANYGLNFVRIPIGYWAFKLMDGDPYVQGQELYLDQALEWCRTYGLMAWIDLHGVPGSQNGFDNSGLRDSYQWQSGNNVDITKEVVQYIANKYAGNEYQDVVIGIELVNEPLGSVLDLNQLENFYYDGYGRIRDRGDNAVIVHDAFQSFNYWDSVLTVDSGNHWNVIVDHHHYQVFDPNQLAASFDQKIARACAWGFDANNEYHWVVNGEWTAALTDCAPWLNGVGVAYRFDGSYPGSWYLGSCQGKQDISTWSPQDKEQSRRFVELQLDAFEFGKNAGWAFWCFKTENTLEWDFKRLVNAQIIPQPLTDRWYPNQCY